MLPRLLFAFIVTCIGPATSLIINAQGAVAKERIDSIFLGCDVTDGGQEFDEAISASWCRVEPSLSRCHEIFRVDLTSDNQAFFFARSWMGRGQYDPSSRANVILPPHYVTRHMAGSYRCTIRTRTTSAFTDVLVDVLYGPGPSIRIHPSGGRVQGTEGEELAMTCLADCRPSCTYRWYVAGRRVASTSFLNMTSLRRQQAGLYACQARNNVGRSIKPLEVSVRFPATIVSLTLNVSTSATVPMSRSQEEADAVHTTDIQLSCKVSGFPMANVTWLKGDVPVPTGNTSSSSSLAVATESRHQAQQTSHLKLPSASCLENGRYTCRVWNGVGPGHTKTLPVTRSCGPFEVEAKAASPCQTQGHGQGQSEDRGGGRSESQMLDGGLVELRRQWGQRVTFELCFWAFPKAKVFFRRQNTRNSYEAEVTCNDTLQACASSMSFVVTSGDQYGVYEAEVVNGLQSLVKTYSLTSMQPPRPPRIGAVEHVTSSSACVTWRPGFDGGAQQKFILTLFHNVGMSSVDRMDVVVDDLTAEVNVIGRHTLEAKRTEEGISASANGQPICIHRLTPSSRYKINMAAYNQHGKSNNSQELAFETLPNHRKQPSSVVLSKPPSTSSPISASKSLLSSSSTSWSIDSSSPSASKPVIRDGKGSFPSWVTPPLILDYVTDALSDELDAFPIEHNKKTNGNDNDRDANNKRVSVSNSNKNSNNKNNNNNSNNNNNDINSHIAYDDTSNDKFKNINKSKSNVNNNFVNANHNHYIDNNLNQGFETMAVQREDDDLVHQANDDDDDDHGDDDDESLDESVLLHGLFVLLETLFHDNTDSTLTHSTLSHSNSSQPNPAPNKASFLSQPLHANRYLKRYLDLNIESARIDTPTGNAILKVSDVAPTPEASLHPVSSSTGWQGEDDVLPQSRNSMTSFSTIVICAAIGSLIGVGLVSATTIIVVRRKRHREDHIQSGCKNKKSQGNKSSIHAGISRNNTSNSTRPNSQDPSFLSAGSKGRNGAGGQTCLLVSMGARDPQSRFMEDVTKTQRPETSLGHDHQRHHHHQHQQHQHPPHRRARLSTPDLNDKKKSKRRRIPPPPPPPFDTNQFKGYPSVPSISVNDVRRLSSTSYLDVHSIASSESSAYVDGNGRCVSGMDYLSPATTLERNRQSSYTSISQLTGSGTTPSNSYLDLYDMISNRSRSRSPSNVYDPLDCPTLRRGEPGEKESREGNDDTGLRRSVSPTSRTHARNETSRSNSTESDQQTRVVFGNGEDADSCETERYSHYEECKSLTESNAKVSNKTESNDQSTSKTKLFSDTNLQSGIQPAPQPGLYLRPTSGRCGTLVYDNEGHEYTNSQNRKAEIRSAFDSDQLYKQPIANCHAKPKRVDPTPDPDRSTSEIGHYTNSTECGTYISLHGHSSTRGKSMACEIDPSVAYEPVNVKGSTDTDRRHSNTVTTRKLPLRPISKSPLSEIRGGRHGDGPAHRHESDCGSQRKSNRGSNRGSNCESKSTTHSPLVLRLSDKSEDGVTNSQLPIRVVMATDQQAAGSDLVVNGFTQRRHLLELSRKVSDGDHYVDIDECRKEDERN